jgi:hypothetical protein
MLDALSVTVADAGNPQITVCEAFTTTESAVVTVAITGVRLALAQPVS